MTMMATGEQGNDAFTLMEHRGAGILYFVFGVMGVLSNSLLMRVFMRNGVLESPKNILHINLAFSNILVAAGFPFSGVSSFYGKWMFGKVGCDLYGIESYTGGLASFSFVVLLCFERYLAICRREYYKNMNSLSWWVIIIVIWLHSLMFGIFPVLGWSEYTMEASGVACGPNWLRGDVNHVSFIAVICIEYGILFILGTLAINSAKNNTETPYEEKVTPTNWFTEKQLVWICFTFVLIACVGWAPYAYFAIWTMMSEIKSVTMFAASCPPLFAKASSSFYAIPYLLADNTFRELFCGMKNVGKKVA